ncbi:MAG: hypothetical protein HN741_03770, partial [Anaerolineae bacterium]|nr:hypothetical protein [Anaerolineae bacterium]
NEAGNRSQKSAQIIIPQPNATALPTFTPTPTATNTPLTTPTATVYNAPLIVPTATQTPFVFLPPEPRETEENNGFFSFFSAPNQLNRASQSTTPSSPTPSTGSGNILWGATAAAALGAFNAVIAEKKRKEAEARWRANIRRNSDYMKMREAEKAGQLDEYLREKNMTESERKHRRELQAIWDANGAAIYEQKKAKVQKEAKRVVARQELHEKQLKHKIDFLEPPPPPPEPSLAEVQARMEKEKQLEQEQALADWKKADMGADSGVVAMRKEVEREERKPWWKKTWETVKEKTQKFASNLSSAAASVLSPRKNVGAYKMASLVADDPPPPVSEDCWWPWVCRTVDKFKDWFSKDKKKQPAPTPNTNATAINMAQTMAAGMQTAQPTSTPIPTATPTLPPTFTPTATPDPSRIDGPLSIEQIPPEFRCTLEEEKVINGIMYVSDYYSMCKTGEYFIEQILTDENGWWWEDGISLDGKSEWDAIKKTEDVWKLALTISLDSEGTTVRRDIPAFSEPFSTAMHNKFWHFDHGVQPSYQNRIDDPAPSLGYNGRLTFLGSLDSINIRTSDMKTGLSASNVIKEPYDGWITNNWQTAQEAINNIVWPEPDWTMPNKHEPYDWANARLMMEAKPKLVLTMTAILNAEIGTDYNQVYYMSSGENSIQILTAEQKEFFYAKSSK